MPISSLAIRGEKKNNFGEAALDKPRLLLSRTIIVAIKEPVMHHLLLNNSCERRRRVIEGLEGSQSLTPIFNKVAGKKSGNYTLVGLISMVNTGLQKLIKHEVTQQLEELGLGLQTLQMALGFGFLKA